MCIVHVIVCTIPLMVPSEPFVGAESLKKAKIPWKVVSAFRSTLLINYFFKKSSPYAIVTTPEQTMSTATNAHITVLTIPVRLAEQFIRGKINIVMEQQENVILQILQYPNLHKMGGKNKTDNSLKIMPKLLMMNPMVKGLRPRPPYRIDVASMSGIRTMQDCLTKAKRPQLTKEH